MGVVKGRISPMSHLDEDSQACRAKSQVTQPLGGGAETQPSVSDPAGLTHHDGGQAGLQDPLTGRGGPAGRGEPCSAAVHIY